MSRRIYLQYKFFYVCSVKMRFKSLMALNFLFVYFFVIGISSSVFTPKFTYSYSEGANYYAIGLNGLSHTLPNENTINHSLNTVFSPIKNSIPDFSVLLNIFEQQIATHYFQYTAFEKSLLIELRITDLIFPFHYFW